jgi:phage shock protein A
VTTADDCIGFSPTSRSGSLTSWFDAKSKRDLLIARHRRSQAATKATRAEVATFDRLKDKVNHSEAVSAAERELSRDDIAEQLARLEKEEHVEKLLAEIKAKRVATH